MAGRLVKLLKASKATEGRVLLSGGLAQDGGLVAAMEEQMAEQKVQSEVISHPDSIYAGAIGAAIWGEFRHRKLAEIGQLDKAS
jgi:benzoyl-CoA reductase subunit D